MFHSDKGRGDDILFLQSRIKRVMYYRYRVILFLLVHHLLIEKVKWIVMEVMEMAVELTGLHHLDPHRQL